MIAFANIYLALFFADAGLSLLDEIVSLLAPMALLSGVRITISHAVIALAVAMYFGLGIDRRLPKRVFLPLILFVFWCPLSTWLFPALGAWRYYGLLAAATQVALVSLPLYFFRQKGGARRVTLPPDMLPAPAFNIKYTLSYCAVTLLVAPLALVIFALYAANSYLAVSTSGFMRIDPRGLTMTERVYRRDNRTVRLTSMIHVGEQEYYDAVVRSVSPGRSIVLAEGVSDDRHLLRNKFDYGKVAGFLGVTSQHDMHFKGREIEPEALEEPLPRPGQVENKRQPAADILRADVDISTFRPPTILFLDAIGKHLRESPSLIKGILSLNRWAEKNVTPEMNQIMMDDILHRRNQVVIRYLDKSLLRYDTVIIPWGALHMKEIEAQVLKRGFKLQEERKRVSIDFAKILLR